MTDPVCNCPYPSKPSPHCPVHGEEVRNMLEETGRSLPGVPYDDGRFRKGWEEGKTGSVRNLMIQLEEAEAIPEDCICHETVVGKGECPVHGPPCQARRGEDDPFVDIGGEG